MSATGQATLVSPVGGGMNGSAQVSMPGSPGSSGPGANMSMASAMVWLVGGAAVITVGVGFLARKGVKPEIGRFDVVQVIFTAAGTAVVFGTVKTLAYRTHGHKLSQAVLMLL